MVRFFWTTTYLFVVCLVLFIYLFIYLFFTDEERIGAKRKKKVQHFGNFFGDGGGAGFGGGAGAGGGGGGGMGNFFSKSMKLVTRLKIVALY